MLTITKKHKPNLTKPFLRILVYRWQQLNETSSKTTYRRNN